MRILTGVTMMTPGFAQNMTSLRELYFPKNSLKNSGNGDAAFTNNTMTKVEKIVLPPSFERLKRYAFQNTKTATLIIGNSEHGSNLLSINDYQALQGCLNVVLYALTPPYWSGNDYSDAKTTPRGNTSVPAGCKIYVPDEVVDTYKNSGNDMWGQYASRIYPISEFEGEL